MKTLRNYAILLGLASAALLAACGNPSTTDVVDNDAVTTDTQATDTPASDTPATDAPPADAPAGLSCMSYCTTIMTNCTADNMQYADMAECVAYCGRAMWPMGTVGEMTNNTLGCHSYHAGVAGTGGAIGATLHCPHAGPSGDGVCGTVAFRTDMPTAYRRVDRMGMPAVATVLVAAARKNAFNDADPAGDMAFAGDFIAQLTALHAALDDDLTGLMLTPCSMTVLVGGLPECLGQSFATGRTVASLVVPNDTLRIDPTAMAGFPNGRRLQDPVIDVTLAVLLLRMNATCGAGMCSAGTLAAVPLNPARNDVNMGNFLATFPYVHPPHAP